MARTRRELEVGERVVGRADDMCGKFFLEVWDAGIRRSLTLLSFAFGLLFIVYVPVNENPPYMSVS